jgi:hypothetical protein
MFPNFCIYLPDLEDLKSYREKSLASTLPMRHIGMRALHYQNQMGPYIRGRVASIVNQPNLPSVAALTLLTEGVHRLANNKMTTAKMGIGMTAAIGEQSTDYVLVGAKESYKALLKAQDHLMAYIKSPHGEKTIAKKAYFEAHHLAKEKVAEFIKRYSSENIARLRKVSFISNREKWLHKINGVTGHDFNIIDTDEFKSIVRVMKVAKVMRGGLIAIPFMLFDAPEIHHLYQTGGDWVKELAVDVSGVAGGIGGGVAAEYLASGLITSLAIEPAGWVIILGGAATAIIGELILKKISEKSIDSFQEHTNDW